MLTSQDARHCIGRHFDICCNQWYRVQPLSNELQLQLDLNSVCGQTLLGPNQELDLDFGKQLAFELT